MKYLLFIFFLSCSNEQITNDYEIVNTTFIGNDLRFFNELNEIRVSKGLKPLKGEFNLTVGCRLHSLYMSDNDSLNHNYFYQRFINSKAVKFGEVVCYGYLTPESQISAYESSVKHYETLMNKDYEYIGIGTINNYQTIDLARYERN